MEKKIKLYKFNELEKDIQHKLVEKEKEYEYNDFCEWNLEDLMKEEAQELLQENFKNATFNNVYYDLSYSQGSGSMIAFTINIKDINNKYHILSDEELEIIQKYDLISDIEITHDNSLYQHEYTFKINCYSDFTMYIYNEDIKYEYKYFKEIDYTNMIQKIENLIDNYNLHYTDSQFIKDIIDMNKELTKRGYDLLEDDDYFTRISYEYLENNDELYFKNGDIYKGDYE